VPILCHHLGFPGLGHAGNLAQVLASARLPNIYIKVSGFAYAAPAGGEYPYPAVLPTVRTLYEAYGARRLCWGSDYPVVRYYMTYRQSLKVFRTHCTFVSEEDKGWILGKSLSQLLVSAGY
jgi:predicted TIM-barrel fold metal-dependent hydrolase